MDLYRKLYFTLFNSLTDALEALEIKNYGRAKEILQKAQQNAEEQYLEQEELQHG
ncbi:MAG: hypothetical protein VB096_10590 [Pseudoflavonifractor sp.]|nr:hypothetical protein [Pseudoflavonifractor sp.]